MSSSFRNFDDVDRGLREWRSRLEVVDENLRELDDEPTLRKLEGRPGLPAVVLEGETARRVGPALRALRDVWGYRGRLAEVIDRAEDLRKSVSGLTPWAEGKQIKAIDDLLNGPSVVVLGATIPLGLRSLIVSAQEQSQVTPSALLQAMEGAFADARDAVFAVDDAWTRLLPSLVEASRGLAGLRGRAGILDPSLNVEVDEIASVLDGLRRQVERDPLAALETSTGELEPRLGRLRNQIAVLEQTRTGVLTDITRAEMLLDRLTATNSAAREARQRSLAEIFEPVGLQMPLSDEQIDGLRPWLATLQGTVALGNWRTARIGLDRWLAAVAEYQASAENALAANSAARDRRDHLAGLLRARGAQAADLARRGRYLSAADEAAARQARALLAEVPCHLDAAEAGVKQFDAAVSALAHAPHSH